VDCGPMFDCSGLVAIHGMLGNTTAVVGGMLWASWQYA
jgi:hypothetical protein